MSATSLVLFCLSFLFNLLLIVGIPVMWGEGFWYPILLKCLADIVLLVPALSAFSRWRLLTAFPVFEIYYTIYVLLYPPLVLTGHGIIWKERTFPRGHSKNEGAVSSGTR